MVKIVDKALKFEAGTNLVGVVRTLLALSLMLTLLMNDPISFFAPVHGLSISNTPLARANFFLILGLEHIELMRWLALAILGLVIFGIYPRFLCLPHAWVALSFATGAEIVEGGDQINALLSLILVPFLLSDSRRSHWSQVDLGPYQKLTAFFTMALFRLQVAFVYYEAGVYKTMVKEWADGTALYYFMNDSVFGLPKFLRPLFDVIFSQGAILTLLTWSVIALELLLAAALFMERKFWKYLLVPALLMHFSIVYIHGLGTFFISMAAALIGFLVPWDRHLRWPRWTPHRS